MTTERRTRCLQVFLLAMSVLVLEVALTRIFAFTMFCHFTYLVISVAMLGFGAAGTYLTVRRPTADPGTGGGEFVATHAWLFGLAAIAAVVLIPRILFYPMDMFQYGDYSHLLSSLVIVIAAGLPFFFAGACIGFIISGSGEGVHVVYFSDLVGAGLGCLAAIVGIEWLGGTATCVAVGAVAMLVAGLSGSARRRGLYLGSFVCAAALAAVVARTECIPLYAPPEKPLFRNEHTVERIEWHPITRIDVTKPVERYYSFGGALSQKYDGPPLETRVVYQDGGALTGIVKPVGTPRETKALGYFLQGAPYVLKHDAEVLTIGCGGGVDVMVALHNGAKHVVGVDVNPKTINLLRTDYAEFSGRLAQRDDVELVVSEGRHFLTRDDRKFDVIQLSGVDTYTALTSGAYALTEYFVYTREALDQYLEHLNDDGIVNFSRPILATPRETLKLAITAAEALEAVGVTRPADHIVIIAGKGLGTLHDVPWAETMIKRSPFTRAEVVELSRWAGELGFRTVYDPFNDRRGRLDQFLHVDPAERRAMISSYPLDIRPATDDWPFFFQFVRWGQLGRGAPMPVAVTIILATLAQVVLLSGLLILYPLYRRQRPGGAQSGRPGVFAYFGALGLGFIMVEVALLQKFTILLGGPAYSMAVTLLAILVFSGLGSLASKRLSANPLSLVMVVVPLLAVLVFVWSLTLNGLIDRMMVLSHFARCLAAVGLVAPLGFLMGMPFPSGLRLVNRYQAALNPWAWGINACATVVGTVLCMIVSAWLGFNHAMQFGAVIYLAGAVAFFVSRHDLTAAAAQSGD